jgi:hypothetical protein
VDGRGLSDKKKFSGIKILDEGRKDIGEKGKGW